MLHQPIFKRNFYEVLRPCCAHPKRKGEIAKEKKLIGHQSFNPPGASIMDIGEPAWYVIRTRSKQEFMVRDQLGERGVENFLPTVSLAARASSQALSRHALPRLRREPRPLRLFLRQWSSSDERVHEREGRTPIPRALPALRTPS